MLLLDLTLPTPAENLALDEALLEEAEDGRGPQRVLRLWESPDFVVVLGRSCRFRDESQWERCQAAGVPVLRRASGGGTVLLGPGCLVYTVLVPYSDRPELQLIERAHQFVLGRLLDALQPHLPALTLQGTSDLTLEGRKFSGNSLRCKRDHLLYHGTLLYDFPLAKVGELLGAPARQPDYRQNRSHVDFVRNLPLDAVTLRSSLIAAWSAMEPLTAWPESRTRQLVAERYAQDAWNQRL
ncbi:MAG: lipoate--protein ligase family protein [Pirellulales bacterium]